MTLTPSISSKHVIFLRWFARISGSIFFMLFALLFFEDGLLFFIFKDNPYHKAALSTALIGILLGWKSDFWGGSIILLGTLADWIIVSIQIGEIMVGMGPLVSFFPIIGLTYLYCWWRCKKALNE